MEEKKTVCQIYDFMSMKCAINLLAQCAKTNPHCRFSAAHCRRELEHECAGRRLALVFSADVFWTDPIPTCCRNPKALFVYIKILRLFS